MSQTAYIEEYRKIISLGSKLLTSSKSIISDFEKSDSRNPSFFPIFLISEMLSSVTHKLEYAPGNREENFKHLSQFSTIVLKVTKYCSNSLAFSASSDVYLREITMLFLEKILKLSSIVCKTELFHCLNDVIAVSNGRKKLLLDMTSNVRSQKLIYELVRLIKNVGDYSLQVSAIEVIFRLTTLGIRKRLTNLLFDNFDLQDKFLRIASESFEYDCRDFLICLNSHLKEFSVVSVPCISIFVGQTQIFKPKDNLYKDFWLDFNFGSFSMSLFCYIPTSNHNDASNIWNILRICEHDLISIVLTEETNRSVVNIKINTHCGKLFLPKQQFTDTTVKIIFTKGFHVYKIMKKLFGKHRVYKSSSVQPNFDLESCKSSVCPSVCFQNRIKSSISNVIERKRPFYDHCVDNQDSIQAKCKWPKKMQNELCTNNRNNNLENTNGYTSDDDFLNVKKPFKNPDVRIESVNKTLSNSQQHDSNPIESKSASINFEASDLENGGHNVNEYNNKEKKKCKKYGKSSRKAFILASENIYNQLQTNTKQKKKEKHNEKKAIASNKLTKKNNIDTYNLERQLKSDGSFTSRNSKISWFKNRKNCKESVKKCQKSGVKGNDKNSNKNIADRENLSVNSQKKSSILLKDLEPISSCKSTLREAAFSNKSETYKVKEDLQKNDVASQYDRNFAALSIAASDIQSYKSDFFTNDDVMKDINEEIITMIKTLDKHRFKVNKKVSDTFDDVFNISKRSSNVLISESISTLKKDSQTIISLLKDSHLKENNGMELCRIIRRIDSLVNHQKKIMMQWKVRLDEIKTFSKTQIDLFLDISNSEKTRNFLKIKEELHQWCMEIIEKIVTGKYKRN